MSAQSQSTRNNKRNTTMDFSDLKTAMATMPSEDEVDRKFLNTVLEKFTNRIYAFWSSEPWLQGSCKCFNDTREFIRTELKESYDLATLSIAIFRGNFKGKGWEVTSPIDLYTVNSVVQTLLLDKFCGYEILIHNHPPEEPDDSQMWQWSSSLVAYPRIHTLGFSREQFEENKRGGRNILFSLPEMEKIETQLKVCIETAATWKVETDDSLIRRFVEFMIDEGVPLTRECYRQLYRALELYEQIPEHIKVSHETTTSSDPHSEYIKSYVNSILKSRTNQYPKCSINGENINL